MRPLSAFALLVFAAAAAADPDTTFTVEAPLATPKKMSDKRAKEPFDKVRLWVWLPGDVKAVRGAVFNPFNEKQVEQKHWQEAARVWGFAVIGADYFGVSQADFGPTLAAGLRRLAEQEKRPELVNIPLAMVGMSAGAGMCMTFADQLPDRTLAVAAVCLEVGPTTEATRKIPTLTVFGEKDGQQMKLLREKLPVQRKDDALWATAVQWGKGHEFAAANNLVAPFFDAVIEKRLPADADFTKGLVKLTAIDSKAGFFARPDTWDDPEAVARTAPVLEAKSDPERLAGWLPDRDTAAVWRAFVSRKPPLAIKTPAPLGGGNAFEPLAPDSPVKVTVTGCRDLTELAIFNGAQELKEVTLPGRNVDAIEVTVPGLKPGVHALIAVGHAGEKRLPPSRPVAVVVRR